MKFWQFVKAEDAKKAIENTIAVYEKKLAKEKQARELLEEIAFSFDFSTIEKEFLFNSLRDQKMLERVFEICPIRKIDKNFVKNLVIDL